MLPIMSQTSTKAGVRRQTDLESRYPGMVSSGFLLHDCLFEIAGAPIGAPALFL